jgi:membrane-associated phospholipid phosphatase
MICFELNLHFLSLLKTVFHDSRPQFDEPSLAVINAGVCAAEFGNPSGHTIIAAHFFLQTSLYFKEKLCKKFPKVRVALIIDVTVYFNLAGIALCRFYLGRHTID